jgi:hypothetical protein
MNMDIQKSTPYADGQPARRNARKTQLVKVIQILSWIITGFFMVSLAWVIYEALVNGNPLPAWAWLGLLVLFAVAAGLGVMVIVYRGVSRETGPFDFGSPRQITGELVSETRRVDAGGASALRANFKMTEGILRLAGGTGEAMEASFTYDDADWKPPQVDYAADAAGLGELRVEQKATGRPAMRQGRCEWVVRLNHELPTELYVRFGAGKAELNLAGIQLTRLQVESGVGELSLDLRGEQPRSLAAFVKTGIGDTTLRLPQNAGVRVQSTVGFGSIQPHGLEWDGEAYTNALYGKADANLEIAIEGGMGKITIE